MSYPRYQRQAYNVRHGETRAGKTLVCRKKVLGFSFLRFIVPQTYTRLGDRSFFGGGTESMEQSSRRTVKTEH